MKNDTKHTFDKPIIQNGTFVFNPLVIQENENKLGWDDQVYINNIKKQLKYILLPLELFPNGNYYYANSKKINPYLIHFNWLTGNDKMKKMKFYKKWYLDLDN